MDAAELLYSDSRTRAPLPDVPQCRSVPDQHRVADPEPLWTRKAQDLPEHGELALAKASTMEAGHGGARPRVGSQHSPAGAGDRQPGKADGRCLAARTRSEDPPRAVAARGSRRGIQRGPDSQTYLAEADRGMHRADTCSEAGNVLAECRRNDIRRGIGCQDCNDRRPGWAAAWLQRAPCLYSWHGLVSLHNAA